jgi:hypothetical protein
MEGGVGWELPFWPSFWLVLDIFAAVGGGIPCLICFGCLVGGLLVGSGEVQKSRSWKVRAV